MCLELDICFTLDQFKRFDEKYFNLSVGLKSDVEKTGCLFPCTYTRYEAEYTKKLFFEQFGFGFQLGSLTTTVRREYYIYPALSFISDIGGTLGLFVGFSFFMLWDKIKDLVIVCYKQ